MYRKENKIQLGEIHRVKKDLKALGDKGEKAKYQEMNQMHNHEKGYS